MIKQIVHDYIHCTQMEFILAHPIVVLGMIAVVFGAGEIALILQEKIRNNKK